MTPETSSPATGTTDHQVDAGEPAELELRELVDGIEPQAVEHLRTLGHHNAATLLDRLVELTKE